MSVAQIIIGLMLLATFAYMIYGYPHRYNALTGRSRLYRTTGLFLLSLLLMLVFMGMSIDFYNGVTRQMGQLRYIFYWLACVLLALTLPVVAFLDSLESFVAVRREKRAYLDKMWQEEYDRMKAQIAKGESGKSAPSDSTREP